MFDELSRLLQNLDGQEVRLKIECHADEDGYIDKECPNERCLFSFKVHEDDWRDIVRDEEVFCPSCGHGAPAKSWFTTEQAEWAREAAFNVVREKFHEALEAGVKAFNRQQKPNRFVTMKMTLNGRPALVQLPLAASEPMRLKMTCARCQCRYSVIGSAYFCPSCGHNAADQVFEQSLEKIRTSLDIAPILRASISDRDTAENTIRALVDGGLQAAITAFQRFAEAIFADHPNAQKVRRNAFQNLDEGSRVWGSALGVTYEQICSRNDLLALKRYFQQRHLLAHREGLVDAEYIAKSGDTAYREGQRLVVRADDVRNCIELIEKLGNGMRRSASPPSLP